MKNLGIFICSLLISAFSASALLAADTLPPGDSAKARSRSAAGSSKQLKLFVFKELATDTVINIVLNSSEIPLFYRPTPARSCFKTSALDAKWSCLDALYWVRVFIPGVWYQNTCREWVFSALNGSRIVVSAKN